MSKINKNEAASEFEGEPGEPGGDEMQTPPSGAPAEEPPGGVRRGRWLKYAGVGPTQAQKRGNVDGPPGAGVTSLGSLEAEIMGVLWDIGRPATGMEVMESSLYRRRARGEEPAAFATVTTTLRRLTEKGLLVSEKNAQRTPVYAPTVEREGLAARILNNVSQTLLGQPLHALLPKLTGNAPTSPAVGRPRASEQEAASFGPRRRSGDGATTEAAVDQLLQALEELAAQEAATPDEGLETEGLEAEGPAQDTRQQGT